MSTAEPAAKRDIHGISTAMVDWWTPLLARPEIRG
jgi:hypothetical protein